MELLEYIKRFKKLIDGWKTHITAVCGWLTALSAWAAGNLTDAQFIAATYACLAAIFLRSGVAKALKAIRANGSS